ncbi:hypothetical protein CLAIMM_00778 [Cladophialophora immunda]|nr:hypothetical protein CLAIMM_00778 [Cladophialophora immunda]
MEERDESPVNDIRVRKRERDKQNQRRKRLKERQLFHGLEARNEWLEAQFGLLNNGSGEVAKLLAQVKQLTDDNQRLKQRLRVADEFVTSWTGAKPENTTLVTSQTELHEADSGERQCATFSSRPHHDAGPDDDSPMPEFAPLGGGTASSEESPEPSTLRPDSEGSKNEPSCSSSIVNFTGHGFDLTTR